jgi:hypothetical protein
VAKERADLVRSFRRENVLEFAGLLLDFRFTFQCQAIREKTLREAVPTNDVRSSLPSARGQFNDQTAIAHRNAGRL